MKKLQMTLLMMCGIALATLPLTAETETVDGYTWTYRINGDTAEIYGSYYPSYGYIPAVSPSPTGCVTIPSKLGGMTVTSIGSYAFSYCGGLASVTIPDSVTSIGDYAFYNCNGLTSMTIPDSVTSIGDEAFYDCRGLTRMTIPNSVTSIGGWAFAGCSGLTNVVIGSGVTSIGNGAFTSCSGLTGVHITDITEWCNISFSDDYANPLCNAHNLYLNGNKVSDLVIPNNVRNIGDYAFSGCSGLTSVTIPDCVTSIGNSAFYNCSGLTGVHITDIVKWCSISFDGYYANPLCQAHNLYLNGEKVTDLMIPDSVTSILAYAFAGCSGITSVTIPNSVTSIGDFAFADCRGLTGVTIPNSVTNIGVRVFYSCSGLTSVTIGNGVMDIGKMAFSGCRGLTSVTMPNSVTSIGDYAFDDCRGLTSVTMGNGVKTIGNRAFSDCSNLTSVTIPDSVTSIGNGAFTSCIGLTGVHITDIVKWCGVSFGSHDANPLSYAHNLFFNGVKVKVLTIPDDVTSIKSYAFSGCSSLTSLKMPNSVTGIGSSAFSNCSGLTSVTIPNSVVSIGESAFSGCSGLTNVTIPDGVTRIGDHAFSGCSGLISMTISDNVTSIGYCAFSDCNGLMSLTISRSVTSIEGGAFSGCSGLTSVTIPDGVTSIGDGAFSNCSGLTSVTIPDGMTSIGDYAFSGCSGLISVTIPGSVTNIGSNVFSDCNKLENIVIGTGVTSIGNEAFAGCNGLSNLVFKCEIPAIDSTEFGGCTNLSCLRVEKSLPLPMFYDMGISRFEVPSPFVDYVRSKTEAEVVGIENCDKLDIDNIFSQIPLSVSSIRAEGNLQIDVSFGELMLPECETMLSVHLIGNGEETSTNFTVKSWISSGTIISPVLKDFDFNAYNSFYVSVSNSLFVGTLDSDWQYFQEASPVALELYGQFIYDGGYEYATLNTGVIKVVYSNDVDASRVKYEIGRQCEVGIYYGKYDWQTGRVSYESTTYLLPAGAPGVLYKPVPTLDMHVDEYGQYVDSYGHHISDSEWEWMLRMYQEYPIYYYHAWPGEEDERYSLGMELRLIIPPMIKTHQVYISTDERLTYHDGGGYTYDPAYVIVDDGESWASAFESYGNSLFGWTDDFSCLYLPYGSYISGYASYISVDEGYYINKISCGDAYIKYDRNGYITETSQRQYDSSWNSLPIFGPVTNDVTYLFESAPIAYNITFIDELGAENHNATTYTVEDSYYFQPPAAVAGWDFLGWDVTGVYNQTGDITVTAQWARSDRTVTFDIGAHGTRTGGGALTQTVVWGEAAESPTITADVGWVFTGWEADISQITESITVTAQYERAPLSIEAASGLDKVWTTSGNVPWYTEWSDAAHDGVNHLHSGAIGDNQESWIETVVTNTGVVSFWWKASSEAYRGIAYDKVVFSVDGVDVASIGGEVDWTNVTYNVEGNGPHALRWTYRKDDSDYGGQDCAWLDEVQYLREVRVTFEDGGATGGSVPAAMTIGEGLEITLPGQGALAWPKHSFSGWRINDDIFAPGTPYTLGYDDVLFTAAWEEKKVSAPTIEVAAWYDTERTAVTMGCETVGAVIHYTLDGSTPTAKSPVCTGSFYLAGSATIKAIAVLDDYFDSDVVSAESVRAPWTPGECLNVPSFTFSIGGDATWFRDRTVTHDSDTAMRSGAIGDGQTSWIETSVSGAGTLTFWWKVSSEAYKGSIYDYARFTVDGDTAIPDIGGEIDWRCETIMITSSGVHTLRWAYVKDSQDKNGSDCAWLDEVTWTPAEPLPPLDPLPALDAQATDGDVAAIIGGLLDVRLSEKVASAAAYTAFRSWVDNNNLSHALVKDAPNAWLSYALDAPGLMTKTAALANEDVVIESITPSSTATGTFDLVVDIAGAEIGTAARLEEALGVEGATELNESAFSSEGLNVTLERTASGKAKATVTPQGSPAAFFVRVKVR